MAPLLYGASREHVLVLAMGALLAPGKRTVTSCLRMIGRAEAANFATFTGSSTAPIGSEPSLLYTKHRFNRIRICANISWKGCHAQPNSNMIARRTVVIALGRHRSRGSGEQARGDRQQHHLTTTFHPGSLAQAWPRAVNVMRYDRQASAARPSRADSRSEHAA
jgi:hypothetical protein